MLDIDLAVSIKRLSVAFVPLMLGIILHEVAHGGVPPQPPCSGG